MKERKKKHPKISAERAEVSRDHENTLRHFEARVEHQTTKELRN
jgi:hypothetical protein